METLLWWIGANILTDAKLPDYVAMLYKDLCKFKCPTGLILVGGLFRN
jgi:hypothetical protein